VLKVPKGRIFTHFYFEGRRSEEQKLTTNQGKNWKTFVRKNTITSVKNNCVTE
jgi:hypothetical protein